MRKFEGILFCTDLDGTLYTDQKTLSRQNLDAIEYFKAEGGLFTFITGRVPQAANGICSTLMPNAPYGCINGAGIYDPARQQYLWHTTLPNEALELVRAVDEQLPDIGIQVNAETNIYSSKDNAAMVHFRQTTGLPYVFRPYDAVQEPILKIIFAHTDEQQITRLAEFLRSHPKAQNFGFIRSEQILYEILPKGVSKGSALRKMAELLGIRREHTIAAGDYHNDVSMLQAAGLSFAVANAVDEAKAAADHVTVSNNDHAIAQIIEGLDKGIFHL